MRVIELRGARTNNLKSLDLEIRPGTLLVVTGPSGAGKSSLAFGTLYAEGQRRYVESFSAYARQFLERLARPDVDRLEPVPAAIAVDRRAPVKTSRSTVATLTELTDHAKQLWAAASELICTRCGARVVNHSPVSAVDEVLARLPGERAIVTYPLAVRDAEEFLGVRETLARDGYRRLLLNGELRELDEIRPSDVLGKQPTKRKAVAPAVELHVVTDRTQVSPDARSRLHEALEAAFERGAGRAEVYGAAGSCVSLSAGLRCDGCGTEYKKPSPGLFSYNSPIGACDHCRGFGRVIDVDWDKVVPDRRKTLAQGAIRPWSGKSTSWERKLLERYCKRAGVPLNVAYDKLSAQQIEGLIEGDGGGWRNGYPGLRRWFKWMETRAYKMHVRVLLSRYRKYVECPRCAGSRFKPEITAFRLNSLTLPEFYALSVREALAFVEELSGRLGRDPSLAQVLSECRLRLSTLDAVGLHYLTLDRAARTLSGGELQRVSLTSALGASLTGTLFVLDEPTVGLHPADVASLLPVVRQLARADNVVVVIESDEHFLRGADRVLELGPGAGEAGGQLVFDGTPVEYFARHAARHASVVPQPTAAGSERLVLSGASGNNLKQVELELPLRALSCVTGVSGSGKSSLVLDTLVPAVQRALGDASAQALPYSGLRGVDAFKSVVFVDQAPLGRTSRGNPATHLGAWDVFRRLFARQPLAREREYTAGVFSFNVAGGRCEACKGEGAETVEMQFLSDVTFSCPQCGGRRFLGPVLDVKLEGKDVAEVLELSAIEANQIFGHHLDVKARLSPLIDVGAGYLRLGQALNTLSGGEAQRLKLAAALAEATRDALIVLDEPTAGLHAEDTLPLLRTLRALVARGNTVVLVEHDMRVAAASDYIVDLGPEAGAAGGMIVAQGTPSEVARSDDKGKTALALRSVLDPARAALQPAARPAADGGEIQEDVIAVRGAREHNLRDLDLDVPRDKLVVVTGPSGSGKSTLAFDVIFAESQRRYLETLSPYVRQYLKQLPRPAVDRVIGTPPSISLEQRSSGGARNSTVATVTEVAHHLRVVFARAGRLQCPDCGLPIEARSVAALAEHAREQFGAAQVAVWAPVVRGRKGAHRELLAQALRAGQKRARIDGKLVALERGLSLDRYKEHEIDLELGSAAPGTNEFVGLLEDAVARADGSVRLIAPRRELLLSTRRACPRCGTGFPELDPRFFSFNTRQGACATCDGQGEIEVGEDRAQKDVHRRAKENRDDLHGHKKAAREPRSEPERRTCPDCGGRRLAGLALHTRLQGSLISELLGLDVAAAHAKLKQIELTGRDALVAALPLREALLRLSFLEHVGLSYLTLDRPAWSLSGGELQRVRLAAQLGSGLTGLLYVLDEPTIGLHPRDTDRLLRALRELTDKGCSVLLVEHDA
ncbi:MAG TPA: excinuclease ABC subunit UvrA, partial [Polyangiales bacterium]|nr:excinuclease ABC subunit UvrA [Polyangiales bacterium]